MFDDLLIEQARNKPRAERVKLAILNNDARYLPDELSPNEIALLVYPYSKEMKKRDLSLYKTQWTNADNLFKYLLEAIESGELKARKEEYEDKREIPSANRVPGKWSAVSWEHGCDDGLVNSVGGSFRRHTPKQYETINKIRYWVRSDALKAWLKKKNKWNPDSNCLLYGWFRDDLIGIKDALLNKYGKIDPKALPERILLILEWLDRNGIPRMEIQTGTKERIQSELWPSCRELTTPVFDKTWEKASGAGLLRTTGYDGYTRSGSQ